jgi:hypothetical protein
LPTSTPTLVPTPPVIKSVDLRYEITSNGKVAFQVITYQDADGDASTVHYEVVSTTNPDVNLKDGPISASPASQKSGTTLIGTWTCGTSKYEVTLRVVIIDKTDKRSNPMEYTIRCD